MKTCLNTSTKFLLKSIVEDLIYRSALSQTKLVLFAQRAKQNCGGGGDASGERDKKRQRRTNGLNSGYYAHTQRTRDITDTAEISFCV